MSCTMCKNVNQHSIYQGSFRKKSYQSCKESLLFLSTKVDFGMAFG